jgi:hypothetical protein
LDTYSEVIRKDALVMQWRLHLTNLMDVGVLSGDDLVALFIKTNLLFN